MGLSYEASKKLVIKGLWLLAIVTLIEVGVSLFGKGHLIPGIEDNKIIYTACAIIIVALSLYKAYFIIYQFMHMGYEAKGLARSVLLPTTLLVWAIIAFFQEGNSWKERKELINEKNKESVQEKEMPTQQGFNINEIKVIDKI